MSLKIANIQIFFIFFNSPFLFFFCILISLFFKNKINILKNPSGALGSLAILKRY